MITHSPTTKQKIDIIEGWALIEADFQREYGINLQEELGKMSWRRFRVLLNGLSGDSVFVFANSDRREGDTIVIDDPEESSRYIDSFFGF